jgi:hypothetical protein
MFSTTQCGFTFLFGPALAALLSAGPAQAQPRSQARLIALQQQNALLQQQTAVQYALQQTNALVQSAYQQGDANQPGPNGASQQIAVPSQINFQQQEVALQIALQQTTALLQVSFRQNSALSQTALRQINILQAGLQQTIAMRSTLSAANGQLSVFQQQTLSQEQASLLGLLSSQQPPISRRAARR